MSIPNIWHLRTVADTSSKACLVCFKPTTAVLITPDEKDHFYVCRGHLKDKGFCSPLAGSGGLNADGKTAPDDAAAAAAAAKKAELEKEIVKVKEEWEAKQRKKEKGKDDKDAEKKDDKPAEKRDDTSDKKDSPQDKTKPKSGDTNDKTDSKAATNATSADDIPRIYALHRNFYQMRLDRLRNAEMARRNRERLNNPTFFPNVPSGPP